MIGRKKPEENKLANHVRSVKNYFSRQFEGVLPDKSLETPSVVVAVQRGQKAGCG